MVTIHLTGRVTDEGELVFDAPKNLPHIDLTDAQKQTIFISVTNQNFKNEAPPNFQPVVGAVVSTLAGALLVPVIFQMTAEPSSVTWFFPTCLFATFVCWLLTRGIVRRTWQTV